MLKIQPNLSSCTPAGHSLPLLCPTRLRHTFHTTFILLLESWNLFLSWLYMFPLADESSDSRGARTSRSSRSFLPAALPTGVLLVRGSGRTQDHLLFPLGLIGGQLYGSPKDTLQCYTSTEYFIFLTVPKTESPTVTKRLGAKFRLIANIQRNL